MFFNPLITLTLIELELRLSDRETQKLRDVDEPYEILHLRLVHGIHNQFYH